MDMVMDTHYYENGTGGWEFWVWRFGDIGESILVLYIIFQDLHGMDQWGWVMHNECNMCRSDQIP